MRRPRRSSSVVVFSLGALASGLLFGAISCNNSILDRETEEDIEMMPPTPPMPTVFEDFPADGIVDAMVPSGAMPLPKNIGDLFGSVDYGDKTGGPCVIEPEDGTLFPKNWLRPRFRYKPGMGQDVFEIRISVPNQKNELRVYTMNTTWVMPEEMWRKLSAHSQDVPLKFSVRGAKLAGDALSGAPAFGLQGSFTIAPAAAEGSIVYWTTAAGTGFKGFKIGEEAVQLVYDPPKAGTGCIGCHSSTPDGEFVAFSAADNAGDGGNSRLDIRSINGKGQQPTWLSAAAKTLLSRKPQHVPSFSISHWVPTDRVMLSEYYMNNRWEILWTDLEAKSEAQGTGWGILPRTGDSRQASAANFAHNGVRVVYVSTNSASIGLAETEGDVFMVPFNNRMGGQATAVMGASDPNLHEYYPTFSPDDQLLAFNRVPNGQSSVNNAAAEVFVLPAMGGTPTRLVSNDPPACVGKKSPGVTNSWPRWSPEVGRSGSRRYYFLTFSSSRAESGTPQLYMAPVLVDDTGIKSFPALPIWNQPATEGNHTPAWDVFKLVVQ